MNLTDPIADMLSRIKNALLRKKEFADIPFSKLKEEIVKLLKEEGFVQSYEVLSMRNTKIIRINLKYRAGRDKKPVISDMQRVSRPSCRIYSKVKEIFSVRSGFGIAILSTSKGIMSDVKARELGLGGEVLCKVF